MLSTYLAENRSNIQNSIYMQTSHRGRNRYTHSYRTFNHPHRAFTHDRTRAVNSRLDSTGATRETLRCAALRPTRSPIESAVVHLRLRIWAAKMKVSRQRAWCRSVSDVSCCQSRGCPCIISCQKKGGLYRVAGRPITLKHFSADLPYISPLFALSLTPTHGQFT